MQYSKEKIIGLAISILSILIFTEIALRLGGLIYLQKQESLNRKSIRQKDTYLIMCLGESTTARQWPVFLEEFLNKQNIGVNFSVIDKGIPGTNTIRILNELEMNLNKYSPDMVITMMGINDRQDYKCMSMLQPGLLKTLRLYKLVKTVLSFHDDKRKESQDFLNILFSGFSVERKSYPGKNNDQRREKDFKQAIKLMPEDDEKWLELARFCREKGNADEAVRYFRKAIEIKPENYEAFTELGSLYREKGNADEAEKYFDKAIEIKPDEYGAYIGIGSLYREKGNADEAEKYFKKAIKNKPDDDLAYRELGSCYREKGNLSEAEKYFKKAMEINPRSDEILWLLGRFYKEEGNLKEWAKYCRKAIENDPMNNWAYSELSRCCWLQGRFDEAEKYLKKAMELNNKLDDRYACTITMDNHLKLKELLDQRHIKYVCVQYPMLKIEPLKKIFGDQTGIIFVENKKTFETAVSHASYHEYFLDMFGGFFGHCTDKGNQLLAQNIADVLLKECFGKKFQTENK